MLEVGWAFVERWGTGRVNQLHCLKAQYRTVHTTSAVVKGTKFGNKLVMFSKTLA